MRVWIKDPMAISVDGAARGLVTEGGRIAELVPAGKEPVAPVDAIFDASRHVVIPGALPFVFTGLQISIGVAWFSLVAAEMVSGDFGLGYLILNSYVNSVTVPMVIGMTNANAARPTTGRVACRISSVA